MDWLFRHLDELDTRTLFTVMRLRVDVFVVEQACAYPELDDHDTAADTLHLLGMDNGTLAAYARAMPGAGLLADQAAIGRVLVAPAFRGRGLGRTLMLRMMQQLETLYPAQDHCLAAQTGVQAFYESLGFLPVSDSYLEDGIPHVDMLRRLTR